MDFAAENRLRIMGTFFPKPPERVLTWRHPATGKMYQLNHVLVRSRDGCRVIDVDPRRLPECTPDALDHRAVVFTGNPRRGRGGSCAETSMTERFMSAPKESLITPI